MTPPTLPYQKQVIIVASTLYPYQKDWVLDNSQFRIWDADRGVGTTWAMIYECRLVAAVQGEALVVTPNNRYASALAAAFKSAGVLLKLNPGGFETKGIRITSWSAGIPPLGQTEPTLVIYDNTHETFEKAYLRGVSEFLCWGGGTRVAVIGSGVRLVDPRWGDLMEQVAPFPGVRIHTTTHEDHLRATGRFVEDVLMETP